MSKLKIQKNKEKIVSLLNQNIDLSYKLKLKGYKKTLKKLENDIVILSNYIAEVKKVDSVTVKNGSISFYYKLP